MTQIITIYTCSICNLACRECVMQHHMAADPNYHMSLDEIDEFLNISKKSHYKFDVILSGGEPLLWRELAAGTQRLMASGVVKKLTMFTNAICHSRLTDEIAKRFNTIRVSAYGYNVDAVQQLKQRFPELVKVEPRFGFWRNPRIQVPLELTQPVVCLNKESMLYDRRIYACPHCLSIGKTLPSPPSAESLSVPCAIGFMSRLSQLKRAYATNVCTQCISNKTVRNLIPQQDINVSDNRETVQIQPKIIELHLQKSDDELRPPTTVPWQQRITETQ